VLTILTLTSSDILRVQTFTPRDVAEPGLITEGLFRRMETAAMAPDGDMLPSFPLPPPQWTLRQHIPDSLVVVPGTNTLGGVFDRLVEALGAAGVTDYSVYGIPGFGSDSMMGFAIVSRSERISDNGRPGSPRWGEPPPRRTVSLISFLKGVFSPNPGRYRVIVITVTPRFISPGDQPTRENMEELAQEGAETLPARLGTRILDPFTRTTALIYEFYRSSEEDPLRLLGSADTVLTAVDHLIGAGIWSKRQLVGP
jgi:hypothetical protein